MRTPWTEFWRKFKRQHVAVIAGVFVVLLVLLAIVAPFIVPYDAENFFDYDSLNARPSLKHLFGVDPLGRDIFSRILMGARISLTAGFVSVAIGALFGTALGLVAGYREGWWDRIIMRLCDVLFAFPGILLAIGIVAILGGGMSNVIIAVSIFSIPTFARLVRGNTLSLKHLTYRRSRAQRRRVRLDHRAAAHLPRHHRRGRRLFLAAHRHVDHHRGEPVVHRHGRAAADAGVGRDAQRGARRHDDRAARGAIFPSMAIFLTVLAFNLLGDGLRDALDPKIDQK